MIFYMLIIAAIDPHREGDKNRFPSINREKMMFTHVMVGSNDLAASKKFYVSLRSAMSTLPICAIPPATSWAPCM
jgi:hypothetical protein